MHKFIVIVQLLRIFVAVFKINKIMKTKKFFLAALLSAESAIKRSTAAKRASPDRALHKNPDTSLSTISLQPGISVVITGLPVAADSMSTLLMPS